MAYGLLYYLMSKNKYTYSSHLVYWIDPVKLRQTKQKFVLKNLLSLIVGVKTAMTQPLRHIQNKKTPVLELEFFKAEFLRA